MDHDTHYSQWCRQCTDIVLPGATKYPNYWQVIVGVTMTSPSTIGVREVATGCGIAILVPIKTTGIVIRVTIQACMGVTVAASGVQTPWTATVHRYRSHCLP